MGKPVFENTDDAHKESGAQRVVIVTGPSGAGRLTAVKALEDTGFETIDNLPLSLVERLLSGPPIGRPLALGIDVRNRDFSVGGLIEVIDTVTARPGCRLEVLYLDCSTDVLVRRYSETRRRHPMAPEDTPIAGIEREKELLAPVRTRADHLIDTSEMSPHDLRADLQRWFGDSKEKGLSVLVQSFSYKRGIPRGVDMVFDCRFLRNPHWEDALRPLDGRAPQVAGFIEQDERFAPFFDQLENMAALLLPAFTEEGKSYLTLAFGCTGGQHRSVAIAQKLGKSLADNGWRVSIRHRELERRSKAGRAGTAGKEGKT